MERFESLTFLNTDWCFLYRLYDLATGEMSCPGIMGKYSAETEDGIPYLAFTCGHDPKRGKPMVSRDQKLSLVYPVRVFVHGENEKGPLSHDAVRDLVKEMGLSRISWEPTLVYRGFAKGKTTWYQALRADTDFGARIHDVRRQLPAAEAAGWEIIEDRTADFPGNGEGICCIELYRDIKENAETDNS